MKILVVGGGGREHAIIRKLKEHPQPLTLFCAPGNGGIEKDATCVPIPATHVEEMVRFAKEEQMDLVVVTPDDPLALGMVDALQKEGIRAFGPTKAAARIESSKVFSKELMKKYHIPTARYEVFDHPQKALAYIQEQNTYPTVIKADGLALGKGVVIAQNEQEAKDALHAMMEEHIFGSSGNRVVIEEFLEGPEVSVLAFCDGKTIRTLLSSMDHKRAQDDDQGPNTGGMGTIAPNPYYTPEVAHRCAKEIFLPTVRAMLQEGCPFQGCLYFGLMITEAGPKVIEYNCRFGDPETQVVLPMLKTDLLTVMEAVIDGTLESLPLSFEEGACACVILASGGYPLSYQKGYPIEGLDAQGQCAGAVVYHAGTALKNGEFVSNGGRVLGVTARGCNLQEALSKAYAAAKTISFSHCQMRNDIGQRALRAK